MPEQGHGGLAVTRSLRALGVEHLFTLTGGHIFPILDGCHQDGIRMIDTRHEQTASFGAEGYARLSRDLGVVAVTAGPGVTNAISALAQARFNCAPVLALAGRAPSFRWGQGSLQEIDHVPFVDPLAPARTVTETSAIAAEVFAAGSRARTVPRGPRFVDFPLDVLFNMTDLPDTAPEPPAASDPDGATIGQVAELIEQASRPVVVAGSNVYLDRAEPALVALIEATELPVFMNGQGRGCIPADHRLAFSRARSKGLKEADLVIVAGTPLDFRLGFGDFGGAANVVHLDSQPTAKHVDVAAAIEGPLDRTFQALTDAVEKPADTKAWITALREQEDSRRDAAQAELHSSASPIHPMRIYGELVPLLERNAIVIGDGGDFVSYAGREVPSYEPGCWLDPGPFGCLGVGPGYAMAARALHPERQIVVMFGDGALGFSGMELETLVRLKLPVVCVVGNNGIWGLEKHPMRALYGYDVVADLRPGIRYDRMMESFGGRGELVDDPEQIRPALERAFDSGEPTVVNVLTDPEVAYPRSSNLA
ncbi:MAG TPA: acetolactate synthase [Actinomycetota bacterium]|nr:acetolactate synthase [Actinomycetota bacterium]